LIGLVGGLVGDEEDVEKMIISMGPEVFQLITSLNAPDSQTSKTFEVLTKLLQDHLEQKSSEIAEKHKFMSGFHYDIVIL
jgi:hypothetical protein